MADPVSHHGEGGARAYARSDSIANRILELQRSAGNRATARLLSAAHGFVRLGQPPAGVPSSRSLLRVDSLDSPIDWDQIYPGGIPSVRLRGAARTRRPTWHEPTLSSGAAALGVDYGWGDRNKIAEDLDELGASFVVRYLSHSSSKNLSRGEADFWDGRDVDVVVVWEDGGNRATGGYDAGRADAHAAKALADACGKPDSAPIYFAVDFDAEPEAVFDYFDGVTEQMDPERVGAYAGYRVIRGLLDGGRISYGWQTLAWSGGQWHPDACLRQIDNGYSAGRGQTVDRNLAMTLNWGQWRPDPK